MRRTAALLAALSLPLGGVLAVAPGAAGASAAVTAPASPSPSPSPTGCGAPYDERVSADPASITSGATTTVTVVRRLEACRPEESTSHEITLWARPAGSSAAPEVVATGRTDSSGRVSFVLAPTASTDYSDDEAYGREARVARVLVDGVGPEPTPTPVVDCRAGATVELDPSTITATGSAVVTVREIPGTLVDLYAYTQPSTDFRLVRSGTTDADGVVRFVVRPPANTRLRAQQRDEDCTEPVFGTAPSVVLDVRTALTLTAERFGVRDYGFAGDSLPARPGGLVVSLYRVAGDGGQVLTAQARASATTGEWRLRRVFTGSGRFGFVVRTGQDLQNAPGSSNVRPTVIH